MTLFQLFTLLVGGVFLYGGIRYMKHIKLWSLIVIAAGVFLTRQALFGEVSKSYTKQQEIKTLKLDDVASMVILPSVRRKILREDTLYLSFNEITRIQACLLATKETLRDNNRVDWACVLKVKKTNNTTLFAGVSCSNGQTILELYSEGEYGTNYGTMINNELGVILEDIIRNHD